MTRQRTFVLIMAANLLGWATFGVYRSVFNNFAVQELGIGPAQIGLLEGVREIPGLLTFLLAAVTVRFALERLYALTIAVMGLGIFLYGFARGFSDLLLYTLVMSVGFHLWFVVQETLVIDGSEPHQRARRLGMINSGSAAGGLLGMVSVLLLAGYLSFRDFFHFAGLFALLACLVALFMVPRKDAPRRQPFIFRWRYRSFYILTLMSGARRHIVGTFAAFALVKLHGASVQMMTTLLIVHSVLGIYTRTLIGRAIDRLGEQRALSLNYAVVSLIFLGYAFVPWATAVFVLFVLDNLMTGFDMAVHTHAGRIVARDELGPSLAMGSTINHIFGVSVPVIGGILWELFGATVPFVGGAVITLVAMAYSWNLDRRLAEAA